MADQFGGGAYSVNSVDLSERIDRELALVEEQRKAKREAERIALLNEEKQLSILDMKIKNQEALIVPADTGINQLDAAMHLASRSLVDGASNLQNQLKSGEIDQDTYAQQMALIRQQVPAMKTFKSTLESNMQEYVNGLAEGTLSNASGYMNDFYGTLLGQDDNQTGDISVGVMEDGQVGLIGTTNNGHEVSIPVSGINNMPKPFAKVQDPIEALRAPLASMAAAGQQWDTGTMSEAEAIFDNVYGGDKKNLMSLAVDRFGMSLADAEELYFAPTEEDNEDSNQLQTVLRSRFMEKAKNVFGMEQRDIMVEKVKLAQQQANLARTKQQMEHANQRQMQQMLDEQKQQMMSENQGAFVQKAVEHKNLDDLVGLNGGVKVVKKKDNHNIQVIINQQGKPILEVDFGNPKTAYQRIQNFMKVKERGEYNDPHEGMSPNYDPVKRLSPLNRNGENPEMGIWDKISNRARAGWNYLKQQGTKMMGPDKTGKESVWVEDRTYEDNTYGEYGGEEVHEPAHWETRNYTTLEDKAEWRKRMNELQAEMDSLNRAYRGWEASKPGASKPPELPKSILHTE